MACKTCAEHRAAMLAAVRSGSVPKIAQTTSAAVIAAGEDAGRKAVRILTKRK